MWNRTAGKSSKIGGGCSHSTLRTAYFGLYIQVWCRPGSSWCAPSAYLGLSRLCTITRALSVPTSLLSSVTSAPGVILWARRTPSKWRVTRFSTDGLRDRRNGPRSCATFGREWSRLDIFREDKEPFLPLARIGCTFAFLVCLSQGSGRGSTSTRFSCVSQGPPFSNY